MRKSSIRNRAVKQSTAVTIDDIDAVNTPSLLGCWKCSDPASGVIPDHSGNGFDLRYERPIIPDELGLSTNPYQVQDRFGLNPGYVTLANHQKYYIDDVAELISWSGKHVVMAITFLANNAFSDIDAGQAWDVLSGSQANPALYSGFFTGFQIGSVLLTGGGRAAFLDPPNQNGSITDVYEAANNLDGRLFTPLGTPYTIASAFLPGAGLYASANGDATDLTENVGQTVRVGDTDLVAQDNRFAICSAFNTSVQEQEIWMACRDIQLWVFDSLPDRLTETLEFMSRNPGAIPKWWIGT